MALSLSRRAHNISPSPTLAVTALAKRLRAEGKPVIGLGAGEPDFDTPAYIKDAAKRALDAGDTKYTPAGGTKELREAIVEKFKRDNGLDYALEQTFVGCGGKGVLHALFHCLLDPGDEVLIPKPYWVSFPEMVKLADGVPVELNTSEFRLSPRQLREAITPKTKLLVLNSPNNPSGAMYSGDELQGLADICLEKGLAVISDETYEKIVYDGREHVSIAGFPGMADRTVTVCACSKTYAMTGWRIGYCGGPADVIKALHNFASQTTSNPTSFAQAGAVAALRNPDESALQEMVKTFNRRRKLMVELANDAFEADDPLPDGAFYHFANVSTVLGRAYGGKRFRNSDDLAMYLLEEAMVAIVPGSGFGMPEHARLSYACSDADIEEALHRIKTCLLKAD